MKPKWSRTKQNFGWQASIRSIVWKSRRQSFKLCNTRVIVRYLAICKLSRWSLSPVWLFGCCICQQNAQLFPKFTVVSYALKIFEVFAIYESWFWSLLGCPECDTNRWSLLKRQFASYLFPSTRCAMWPNKCINPTPCGCLQATGSKLKTRWRITNWSYLNEIQRTWMNSCSSRCSLDGRQVIWKYPTEQSNAVWKFASWKDKCSRSFQFDSFTGRNSIFDFVAKPYFVPVLFHYFPKNFLLRIKDSDYFWDENCNWQRIWHAFFHDTTLSNGTHVFVVQPVCQTHCDWFRNECDIIAVNKWRKMRLSLLVVESLIFWWNFIKRRKCLLSWLNRNRITVANGS